jgi:prepilin-type N-terminal cleavage/methylation domain-containing protein
MTMSNTQSRAGFTLIDMVVTMSVMCILMAMAAPSLVNLADGMKLGQGQRDVETELNSARTIAVSANRPIRVRFNCPASGQFRRVELIGTPKIPDANDTASDRCSDTKWKFPANDTDPTTKPNHDGALRRLPANVGFGTASTLEFWPNGTVHYPSESLASGSDTTVPVTGTAITVTRGSEVKTIRVNGLGKIELVQ